MHITIRRIGEHRGAPRLYIDSPALAAAGFQPGQPYSVEVDETAAHVKLRPHDTGARRVSKKTKGQQAIPVIDINSAVALRVFNGHAAVRVILRRNALDILAVASNKRAIARAGRLKHKVCNGKPLEVASIAFGAGVTCAALHAGLADEGLAAELVLANEISPVYLDVALSNNPVVTPATRIINTPMQEAVQDAWLMQQLESVDILEAGIPCSGASRAGVAKRGLAKMEDHPVVGHLVAAVIQWIAALQPSIVIAENVVGYRDSGSAAILRQWLRDAGYGVSEVVLDARRFGSPEARVRWFLVAHPIGMSLDLQLLESVSVEHRTPLGAYLEQVSDDSPEYRTVEYLKAKELRDAEAGNGFGMQLVSAESFEVPTLRKGYHKGGSTDPRLVHPTDPERSRLLTATEHARIKGIDETLLRDVTSTTAHQVCGQAVDTRPVRALGQRLATSLKAWKATDASESSCKSQPHCAVG